MLPPDGDPAASVAVDARPLVDVAERVREFVDLLEVLLLIPGLSDQQADLDQREHDPTEVLGPGDPPVRQHVGREQAQ